MALAAEQPRPDSGSAALAHVLGRLAVLEQRVRAGMGEPARPHDLLVATERAADEAAARGAWLPLRDLAVRLDLSPEALDLLLAAAAPHLDPDVADVLDPGRHDGNGQGEVRAHVAVKRLGLPAVSVHRLLDSSLVTAALLVVHPGYRLGVAPAVLEHLLVLPERPSEALTAALAPAGRLMNADAERLATALRIGLRFCYLQEPIGGLGPAVAAGALDAVGVGVLHVDLSTSEEDDTSVRDLLDEALLRARLAGAALVVGPAQRLLALPDRLARLAAGSLPVVVYGAEPWQPAAVPAVPWVLVPQDTTAAARVSLWRDALVECGHENAVSTDELTHAVGHLHLAPSAVHRSVLAARLQALGEQRELTVTDLVTAARAQSGATLQRLAKRISPAVTWDDLVIPPPLRAQLQEVCTRARQRDLVMGTWHVGGRSSRKRGTVALFGGPPGTGKSLAAEVVGAALGLEVYQVNLATVVDKYVGETEKNLDRVFRAAEGVNCLLFFDEADALFGKRSEVKDAQDKYANVEVAYLLQRLEDFDGVAVLASNLRGNLDDAFKRRIDVLVDFPLPDAGARELLWRTCLGPEVALAPDVDLQALAAFDLAGGDIRNVAVGAAMAAAEDAGPVTMRHLVRAVQTEYRKLGRLSDTAMFADLQEFLTLDAPAVAGKRQPARAAKPSA